MSQQTINVGAAPNDGTGTPLRTAFQYTNSNFTELYTALGGGSGLPGASTQVIFNDGGTNLAGDNGLVFNKTTDTLGTGRLTTSGDAIVCSSTGDFYVGTTLSPQFKVERATGAATITGDLTVDTSTLKVDSANNRVGIGTASPISQFANTNTTDTITGTVTDGFAWRSLSNDWAATIISRPASGNAYALRSHTGGATASDYPLWLSAGASSGNTVFTVTGNGIFTFGDGAGGTRMTLNSTGLGVGASPNQKFVCAGPRAYFAGGGAVYGIGIGFNTTRTAADQVFFIGATDSATPDLVFSGASGAPLMRLDATGNVGVGITPSYRLQSAVASGADGNIFAAQVLGASNGFQVLWNHATTTTRVIIANIPTSSAGLAAGTLWNDAGTIKIA